MNLLLDLGQTNPRVLHPRSMSTTLGFELLKTLSLGDFNLNQWSIDFINSALSGRTLSVRQKTVIYNLSRKFNVL